MNNVLPALVPAIGWALLNFLWQGLLIGWGATLALHLLRGARPQTRYAVACAALLMCVALPLASIAAHLIEAHGANDAATAISPALPMSIGGAAALPAMPALLQGGWLSLLKWDLSGQLAWIVLLWSCGAALMTLRLTIGLQWVREQTAPSRYQRNPYWQRRLSELARRFDIAQHVRLGVADLLDSPITAGCWRPIVLVPASLVSGMPPDLLEALLAHELAHIRRHDYLVNLIQSAIEILLFYHPSVWALSRRIRIEREQVADDIAVAMLGQPQRLAQALSELDRFQFATTQLAHAAHGGNLMSRIKRLLRPDVEPLNWKMALPLLGLCAASVVLYAHAAPQSAATDAAQSTVAEVAQNAETAQAAQAAEAAPAADVPAVPEVPPAPRMHKAPPAAPAMPAAPALPAAAAMPALPATPAAPALPASAAMPAPPAPPAPPHIALPPVPPAPPPSAMTMHVERMTMQRDGSSSAYALVHGGQDAITISGSTDDLRVVGKLQHSVKGDFVWTRDGEKTYLVQDPAIIARIDAAWQPVKQIDKKMEAQGALMDQQGKAMDALGKRMDAVGSSPESVAAARALDQTGRQMDALGRQMDALGRQMDRVGSRMADANAEQRASLQTQMAQIQAQMQPVQEQMKALQREMQQQSAKLREAQVPVKDLSQQMKAASKPMSALGHQMGELGHEQARAAREAERTTRELLRDAIRSGKAVPAPSVGEG